MSALYTSKNQVTFQISLSVPCHAEVFDTSKIVYEVPKTLAFLENPYGITRVSRNSRGFWGNPGDSRGFQVFLGILGDSRVVHGFPRDSTGFQGFPIDTKLRGGVENWTILLNLADVGQISVIAPPPPPPSELSFHLPHCFPRDSRGFQGILTISDDRSSCFLH